MNPLRDLIAIQERLNQLFEDQLRRNTDDARFTAEAFSPPVDMYETEGEVVAAVEVPGVRREDIELEITGRVLSIRGERKRETSDEPYHRMERHFGPFERRLEIPESVDGSRVRARYHAGVLTIRLPKKDGGGRATIRVEVTE